MVGKRRFEFVCVFCVCVWVLRISNTVGGFLNV